jgi:hypothetical protein
MDALAALASPREPVCGDSTTDDSDHGNDHHPLHAPLLPGEDERNLSIGQVEDVSLSMQGGGHGATDSPELGASRKRPLGRSRRRHRR